MYKGFFVVYLCAHHEELKIERVLLEKIFYYIKKHVSNPVLNLSNLAHLSIHKLCVHGQTADNLCKKVRIM